LALVRDGAAQMYDKFEYVMRVLTASGVLCVCVYMDDITGG